MMSTAKFFAAVFFAAMLAPANGFREPVPQQARQIKQIPETPVRAVEEASAVKARFNLGETFGDRHEIELRVTRPGRIQMRAAWTGSAERLTLILNGPGQTGYYDRKDGASPLEIDFEVSQAHVNRGDRWTISVVNFGGGYSRGRMIGEYPAQVELIDLGSLQVLRDWNLSTDYRMVRDRAGSGDTTEPADDPVGEPRRTIFPDGTVEIEYPDGTIRRTPPGCGYTIIRPDGTIMQTLCSEVQGPELPDLPSDLSNDELNGWLNGLAERLLSTIALVVNDEEAVENYLSFEEGKPLLERIELRSEAIKHLMAAPPPF